MEKSNMVQKLALAYSKGSEAFHGVKFIQDVCQHIAVFGSARIREDASAYQDAVSVGEMIAQLGYGVITGGGPGLMEAANKGASILPNRSFSASIELPDESTINQYSQKNYHCNYFAIRKMLLTNYCDAIILLPGGYGTFDELFEVLTLIKTKKMPKKPIILFDRNFWQPMMTFLTQSCLSYQTVNQDEIDLLTLVDNVDECRAALTEHLCLQT